MAEIAYILNEKAVDQSVIDFFSTHDFNVNIHITDNEIRFGLVSSGPLYEAEIDGGAIALKNPEQALRGDFQGKTISGYSTSPEGALGMLAQRFKDAVSKHWYRDAGCVATFKPLDDRMQKVSIWQNVDGRIQETSSIIRKLETLL